MVIDKPQKVEIQKIDSMVVLIWLGDLMLNRKPSLVIHITCSMAKENLSKI